MKYVNLTSHEINIYAKQTDDTTKFVQTVKPDGTVARVATVAKLQFTTNDGVPFYRNTTGKVQGLPQTVDGVVFIVSTQVRLAVPDRIGDVASPGDLLRDDKGNPIGCIGLVIN